jgi:hypothetical protein
MLTAWHVYLPIDRQSILSSVKLPSYLFWSSLVSNIHLMIDCGILSTVQVIVAVSFSFTISSLEILEMVGWSTNNDKFKPYCVICIRLYNICIPSARIPWSSNSNDTSVNIFELSDPHVHVINNLLYFYIVVFVRL